jgi:hypothetical protein
MVIEMEDPYRHHGELRVAARSRCATYGKPATVTASRWSAAGRAVGESFSVPWCASCDRFLSPPTVTPDGACPECGRPVDPGGGRPPGAATDVDTEVPPQDHDEEMPVPLHMKILGASVVIYLGYRFFQGVEWVVRRFS